MKNIMIIGGRDVGKTALVNAMKKLADQAHMAADQMKKASTVFEKVKPFVITNPYKDDILYDGSYHKTKEKKAYWSKGKKKYK